MSGFAIKYQNGQEETKVFAPLSITERRKFVDLFCAGDSPALVAHCARTNLDWVNSLDFDCYLKLVEHFVAANFSDAAKMAKADVMVGLKMAPIFKELRSVLASEPLATSSPTPPLASAPGNDSPKTAAPPGSAAETR